MKPRPRTPTPVGSLLGSAVPPLAERLLEERIRREWRSLSGPEIARRCQPKELRSGTLEIVTDNSPWLQELALRESELLARLARRYGIEAVRALRFSLGAVSAEPHIPPRRGRSSRERPTAPESQMIDAAVSLIADPELRGSVRRLLEKACVAHRARGGER